MPVFPGAGVFPGATRFPGVTVGNTFIPPNVVRRYRIEGGLTGEQLVGLSVFRIDGQWHEAEFPSWEQEQSADLFFRGGTICTVDEDTAADLVAAGYELPEVEE